MDKRKDNANYKERGKLRLKGDDAALRAHLLAEIEANYQSVFKFCKERDFERKDVGKFLSGKRSWSLAKTLALLAELDYVRLSLAKEPMPSGNQEVFDFMVERVQEGEKGHEKREKAED